MLRKRRGRRRRRRGKDNDSFEFIHSFDINFNGLGTDNRFSATTSIFINPLTSSSLLCACKMIRIRSFPFATVGLLMAYTSKPTFLKYWHTEMHRSFPGTTTAWIGDGLGNSSKPEPGKSAFKSAEIPSRKKQTNLNTLVRRISPSPPIIDLYACWMETSECCGRAVEYTNGRA